MIKIAIVEDQKILLDGIAASLTGFADFRVVGKLTDASEIIRFLKDCEADAVLTDICTDNGNNSLDFVSGIKKAYPEVKIVVMTGLPEISFVNRAKAAGADSFVYKNISAEELATVIRSTVGGYTTYPKKHPGDGSLEELTPQEMRVLRLICSGSDRKAVMEKLHISESSAKTHITNILSKTGFSSIAKLAISAVANGFIRPDESTPTE